MHVVDHLGSLVVVLEGRNSNSTYVDRDANRLGRGQCLGIAQCVSSLSWTDLMAMSLASANESISTPLSSLLPLTSFITLCSTSTTRSHSKKMQLSTIFSLLLTASAGLAAPLEERQACSPRGISGADASRVKASFTASGE